MGLHTGEAELDPGGDEYAVSHAKNRIGRIHSAAHGGQILLSQETADLVLRKLPEGVTLRDMGEHRLKGMQWLEHLYQVCAPGLPLDFPPLATATIHPHNLPVTITSFIGREREIAAVVDLLRKHRLVTLTGSGGVGKTRLCLEIAAQVLDDYPAGVWYVELAPLSDPDLVTQTVAYTLGLRHEAGVSILDTLTFSLSGRQVLLILDNCEHLIETCASLADHLLVHCPKLRLLASSREALGVTGETAFRVPSLSIPDPHRPASPESLAASEGVRLFIERAQLSLPGFRLTAENAQVTAQVCQRLDGIPLAIELAAARLGVLPVAQIASRLDDAFRLLTGGSRTALPRHQTLRATIDWSYRLLNPKESRLFRRLSVFAGGWTLEAAEAICSGQGVKREEMLDLLSFLVGKSLVIAERKQGEETRFHLLETVRQYAREKLFDEQESQVLHTRHRDYFLHLAEVASTKYANEARLEWAPRVKIEHDNLRLALEWSYHDCAGVEAGLRIAVAISRWWDNFGYERETGDWLRIGLERCGSQPISPLLHAKALDALGRSLWLMGDFAGAQQWLEMGIAACREIGDEATVELCEALYSLGMSYSLENPTLARSLLDESVAVGRRLDPAEGYRLGLALYFRAYLSIFNLNEPDRARQDAQESYNLYRRSGNRWECAGPLIILGWLAHERGEDQLASQHFEEGLALWEEVDDQTGLGYTHMTIGVFYRNLGDFHQSNQHGREALRFWNFAGSRGPISTVFLAYFGSLEVLQSQDCPAAKQKDHLRKAALLLGAAEKLRGGYNFFSRTFTLESYNRDLELLRSHLDDTRIARAWSEGQSMSLDQAWTYLLEEYG
jgi:predicted ATPase